MIRPNVRFGSLADILRCGAMSALPPKAAEIADIAGPDEGQSTLLCPVVSDVDLLCYGEGIVHINAEIPDSALYLGVTKQKLDGAQIPGAA